MKKLTSADLPADDTPVPALMAWLAGVELGVLASFLRAAGADEAVMRARLRAFRDTHALRAAQARREAERKQHAVPALVDELLRSGVVKTKKMAFAHLAVARHIDVDTVRNAYYAERNREDVNP